MNLQRRPAAAVEKVSKHIQKRRNLYQFYSKIYLDTFDYLAQWEHIS